ncbi:hypothetical protein GCM10010978_30810 [Compostibacillus humi]|uniref:Uncharacterized protein n=1 Tax=Compostibacillus humi TaxID=1245525 RepID=A0A8J2XAC5_9BACI|nr:hypothetical protein GCM10010978_30810 [Compostibacillus humi]
MTSFYMLAGRAVALDNLVPHFMYNTYLYYMKMGGTHERWKSGECTWKLKKTG